MAYQIPVFGSGHSFDLEINGAGLDLITRWEVFSAKRYKDAHRSGFKWAIGFGHVEGGDNDPITIPEDMVITLEQARSILALDLEDKARWLRGRIKVPVNTYMFNALVSLTINAGEGNVRNGRVLTLINEERYVAGCAAFLDHRYAYEAVKGPDGNALLDADGKIVTERVEKNGLICRRATEMSLFVTKV